MQKDGKWGAIDVNGDVVLPFIFRYSPTVSADSTLVYGFDDESNKFLYKLSFADESAAPATWTETKTSGADAEAPVLADGAWECSCGAINTGKFCAECGGKKPEAAPAPAADGSWGCVCGSVNTGKFCPECGAKKPEAPVEPQCASCGYKPEGTAPKFCPECGSKF